MPGTSIVDRVLEIGAAHPARWGGGLCDIPQQYDQPADHSNVQLALLSFHPVKMFLCNASR